MDPSEDDLDRETFNNDPEEFDAFNDDTFGASADAWNEDDHENLAKLTEEEIHGFQAGNDFFELDNLKDDGDCLEPPGEETLNGDLETQLESLEIEQSKLMICSDLGGLCNPFFAVLYFRIVNFVVKECRF